MPTSSPSPSSVTKTPGVDTGDPDCTVSVGLILFLWDVGLGVWVTGILDSVSGVMVSVSVTLGPSVLSVSIVELNVGLGVWVMGVLDDDSVSVTLDVIVLLDVTVGLETSVVGVDITAAVRVSV